VTTAAAKAGAVDILADDFVKTVRAWVATAPTFAKGREVPLSQRHPEPLAAAPQERVPARAPQPAPVPRAVGESAARGEADDRHGATGSRR
jgi:hypothetical protein